MKDDVTPEEIIADQEAAHRRELKRLDDIAFVYLSAAAGDVREAEMLLEHMVDLLFEGGAFQLWRYRYVLNRLREGL